MALAALAAPILIMTSFSLWRHSWPARPVPASHGRYRSLLRHSHRDVIGATPTVTNERTDFLPRLMYKDYRPADCTTRRGLQSVSVLGNLLVI